MSSDHFQKFIEYLQDLEAHDRGALARLRRSLAFEPGAYTPAFPYVERFVAADKHLQDATRLALYVAAGLFALHPRHGGKSLASSLGQSMRQRDSASIEQRFIALLGADAKSLPNYLRQTVSLLAADGHAVDYAALADDLTRWLNPHADPQWLDRVRQRWARDFYANVVAAPSSTETTPDPVSA